MVPSCSGKSFSSHVSKFLRKAISSLDEREIEMQSCFWSINISWPSSLERVSFLVCRVMNIWKDIYTKLMRWMIGRRDDLDDMSIKNFRNFRKFKFSSKSRLGWIMKDGRKKKRYENILQRIEISIIHRWNYQCLRY